jgi:hypothetical protein
MRQQGVHPDLIGGVVFSANGGCGTVPLEGRAYKPMRSRVIGGCNPADETAVSMDRKGWQNTARGFAQLRNRAEADLPAQGVERQVRNRPRYIGRQRL